MCPWMVMAKSMKGWKGLYGLFGMAGCEGATNINVWEKFNGLFLCLQLILDHCKAYNFCQSDGGDWKREREGCVYMLNILILCIFKR